MTTPQTPAPTEQPAAPQTPQPMKPKPNPKQRAGFGLQHFKRKQDMGYTEQQQFFDNLRPGAQQHFQKAPDQRAQEQLGYVPTFFQDPKEVAKAHQIIKATPQGAPLPEWIASQKDQITEAYNWFAMQNKGRPDTEWKHLTADDPALTFFAAMQGPPKEQEVFSGSDAVQQGMAGWEDIDPAERQALLADPNFDITQYPAAVRDQILNDPNFDWNRVPKWQRKYWEVMSNPKIMASPMALAGGRAGAMFGPVGTLAGAGLGYTLGLIGGQQYDPTAGVFDQPTTTAGMMAVLNKLSEGTEQVFGFLGQYTDAALAGAQGNEQAAEAARKMLFDPAFREATWKAGMVQYEVNPMPGAVNALPMIARLLGDRTAELAPGGYDWVIGYAHPVERNRQVRFNPIIGEMVDVQNGDAVLREVRLSLYKAIQSGASEDQVREILRNSIMEQSQYVGGQVSDLAGQMMLDPLEVLPSVTNKVSAKLATVLGNETAARAFTETSAPFEAARRYKTLVQSGDVPANFDYSQMGSMSRWFAGLNEQGQIKAGTFTSKGLLDAPGKRQTGVWSRIKEDWTALTPEARAREGASMFYNNVSALLSTFDDPAQVRTFINSLSGSDMKLWRDMGGKIANSPEWYTILPALKDFDTKQMDGLMAAWDLAAPKRETMLKIADVLGEEPGKFVEDLARRGTAEQDYQRVIQRLQQSQSPQARQLLDAAQRGEFTADSLKDIVEAFTGDGALYWHPDQFKAATLDALGAHFDEWTANRLGLADDPTVKSAFFRTTHLLKSAQSVLLLGGSPGYALQNGLSNMVHRAATGIYGYMTPRQMDAWLDRFGVKPARLQEGVGMGGIVETARTTGSVKTDAIDKALRKDAPDTLGKAQRFVSKIGKGMPFNKLSSWFESIEGKNGYMIAMRDMWSKTWRRGTGFQEMTPDLRAQVERAGINPNTIYSLIEAGMNKAEIESHILGRQSGIMARSLVHDAAQKAGMTSSQASTMLEKIGVLDDLDRTLRNANTPDKVRNAFRQAVLKAQDYNDMQTARDLQAMAEDVKNKVTAEGAPAALDVIQRVNSNYFDVWLDHYARFGEMFEDLREIPDLPTRNKAIELNYKISDGEFRRINARTAANYQAIFDTWGRSDNPHARQILASLAQQDASMKRAYDYMRQVRREYFDAYAGSEPGDLAAQAAWFDGQAKIDAEFQIAFDQKAAAERAQGDAMGNLYDEMYGPAAGEAARKWWKDYTTFSADIVKRERKFRSSLAGMPKEMREAAKNKYYGQDKVAQIAELEKINQEGIQRLEKVIKRGGQGGAPTQPRPIDPTQPPKPTPFDDVNRLLAEAEQRKAAETQAKTQRTAEIWDIAENYAREGMPFDRGIVQDYYSLMGALKKEEYGGIPDLTNIYDTRITPDFVRQVLDRRAEVKAAERDAQVKAVLPKVEKKAKKVIDSQDISLLKAIQAAGGIKIDLAKDLTGEARPKGMPGLFKKKGQAIDNLIVSLVEDGFPIDVNRADDLGGVRQFTELLDRARRGERIYPMGKDYNTEILKAEQAYYTALAEELTPAPFDPAQWQAELDRAVQDGDLTALYERIGELPEEMGTQARPSGETWNDYVSRIADETAARVERDATDTAIAEGMVRAEETLADMNTRGEAAMTRQLFREQIQEAFNLTDEQANAYMELSETVSQWYARQTGENADGFYARYYEEVKAAAEGDGELYQLQPINRRMSAPEIEGYARALVRQGADELRRAVQNEPNKADRIAILNEAHKLNPDLAKQVAKDNLNILYQTAYHGSPYKFDKFTTDKIGTGEGAQAYGWGLYFTDSKAVGEFYRSNLAPLKLSDAENNLLRAWDSVDNTKRMMDSTKENVDRGGTYVKYNESGTAIAVSTEMKAGYTFRPYNRGEKAAVTKSYNEAKTIYEDRLRKAEGLGQRPEKPGQLYAVDIPDEGYLLWDRPLSEQPPIMRVLEQFSGDRRGRLEAYSRQENVNADTFYRALKQELGSDKAASLALKEAGINGIKYLDGTSRTKGEGSYNYVIFDDNAVNILETYYQATTGPAPKGAVTFGPDGIKATIHAFEAKDFSTLVHENAHVFRRMLADVAARTDNQRVKADLATLEEWAGAKDGVWDRAAEEKFARGFEKYIADGEAPTPKLRRAFESFKQWMVEVYRTITGSAIDVEITPNVREVFDRLMGEDILYQREFGKPKQKGLFETGDDTPLFSGAPQRAQVETFQPQAQPKQGTLFGMRPEFGKKVKKKVQEIRASDIPAMTFETFAAQYNGATRLPMAEEFQRMPRATKTDYKRAGKEILRRFAENDKLNEEARAEYDRLIKSGEMRPPSRVEELAKTAAGHPDNPSVQAARRLLAKYFEKDGRLRELYPEIYAQFREYDPNTLFQSADKPFGTMDNASGFKADGEWMDQGWSQHVKPLLDSMQDVAIDRLNNERPLDGAVKDLSPEGQKMLGQYIKQVQNDMGAVKLSTMKWGESQRDFAMLNYNRRYGFDKYLEVIAPYQFFYTRSLMTWGMRALDKPAWFANYARIRNAQNQHERDIPERLRNKFKIDAPWLPDWMGDALYIDPIQTLFTPANFARPFETMMQDKNYQVIETERILQEWAEGGQVSQDEILKAAQTQEGSLWERAQAEASIRRESQINSPFDFMATMFGPAWYLSTPLNLLGVEAPFLSKGDRNKVSSTPLLNTSRAVQAVTKGTWAEPIGQLIGLAGKPEQWLREKQGLPEFGEYGDYYVDRQIANMVADGMINSQQAQMAMIERQGDIFEQAKERVRMELALRVPLMGTLYAATHEGAGAAAQAFLPSLFGSGLLPAGELEYRGLKTEWNAAWKKYDAGDKTAVTAFFEDHPEYEAYLAKGKEPEERLRSFMIGNIWDAYMALGETNKKAAVAQMGEDFDRAFLDKETRSYESIDVATLTRWAQMLQTMIPNTEQTAPTLAQPAPTLDLYDPQVTTITDKFFADRKKNYNDYYFLERGYYALPKSDRAAYLAKFPRLRQYWDWKKDYYDKYPELQPIFKGQVFKQVDTSQWPPALEDYVAMYAMTGKKLPKGAYKSLEQVWIREGMPMGDMQAWLDSQVVPAMLYQPGQ